MTDLTEIRRYEVKALNANGEVCVELTHECDGWTRDSAFCQILLHAIRYGNRCDEGASAQERWPEISYLATRAKALADHELYELEIEEIARQVQLAVNKTKKVR